MPFSPEGIRRQFVLGSGVEEGDSHYRRSYPLSPHERTGDKCVSWDAHEDRGMPGKRDAIEWHLPPSLLMELLPQLAEVTCRSHTLPDLGSCVASLNRILSRC